MRARIQTASWVFFAVITGAWAPTASALQPLSTFVEGAAATNPEAVIARANVRQREAEVDRERAGLLPSVSARGVYTRNQYPVLVSLPGGPTATITPANQTDAFLVLDVPVVDVAQYAQYETQKKHHALSEARVALMNRQLQERVVRGYYTLAALWAVGNSAERSLQAAQENLAVVQQKVDAGAAAEVDLARATANVERARQDVVDAELARVLAARTLETLSGVTPEPPTEFPQDDLTAESGLDSWLSRAEQTLPELRVARLERQLAESGQTAARLAYLPTLSLQAQERITNATGFLNRNASYTLSASLGFRFDLGLPAQQRVAAAVADQSRARASQVRRSTEDSIVEAWQRVRANIEKARSARTQFTATETAARIVQDRYGIGAATQLDVTQAQRDAFGADVARIQADLEVVQSRAVLRLAAGLTDLTPSHLGAPTPTAP